jgi:hypothetical protein
MADNPEITSRAAGESDTLRPRTTEVSPDVHIQHVRLDFGSGTAQLQVEEDQGLPVEVLGTVPVSAAALPLPTGAASESKLIELDNANDAWIATQSGSTAVQSLATVGGASGQLLAANPNRKGLIIRFTEATYVGFDAEADANGMLFEAGSYLNMLSGFIFKGAINGLRVGGVDTTARVVEF